MPGGPPARAEGQKEEREVRIRQPEVKVWLYRGRYRYSSFRVYILFARKRPRVREDSDSGGVSWREEVEGFQVLQHADLVRLGLSLGRGEGPVQVRLRFEKVR